jgi:hypothetical protein
MAAATRAKTTYPHSPTYPQSKSLYCIQDMKIILIIVFVNLISFTSVAQEVLWDRTKKLTFGDFKFPVIEKPRKIDEIVEIEYYGDFDYSARSIIELYYAIDVSSRPYLRYRIFASFRQFHSYILGKSDTMVLKHEQGHFDICELYCRVMRKYLNDNALSKYTEEDFTHALDSIYICYNNYDSLYDRKTYEYFAQIEWSEKILRQIDSLSEYAHPEKEIKLN